MKLSANPSDERAIMRIAYIVGSFPYISETFIANQVVGMAARGHQIDIFTTILEDTRDIPAGVRRYRLMESTHYLFGSQNYLVRALMSIAWILRDGWRMPWVLVRSLNVLRYGRAAATFRLLCAAFMLRRINGGHYDIVHCQFGTFGILALDLQEIGALRGRLIVSFRGFDATKYLLANPHAYDVLFRKGELFLPVSHALASRLVEAGCDPAKVHVHHSGIECARFRYQERKRALDESTKIVMIGRLVEKKGISYGIQAIARVIASGRVLSCTIIGDGPLRGELEKQIRELDVGAHVRMVGSKSHSEVIEIMAQSHILIAPSVTATDGDGEGIPNTVKEAMATGLPVISTVHAGIPELVEDGVSGFLVPERDTVALADRLKQLVDCPESWAALGRAGRQRIEAEFDIDKLNDELLALYTNIQAKPEQHMLKEDASFSELRASLDAGRTSQHKRSARTRQH